MPKETLINVIFRFAGSFAAEHQPWFDCAHQPWFDRPLETGLLQMLNQVQHDGVVAAS